MNPSRIAIDQLFLSSIKSEVFIKFLELDLANQIVRFEGSLTEIAAHYQMTEELLIALCTACQVLGLLDAKNETFDVSELAKVYFVSDSVYFCRNFYLTELQRIRTVEITKSAKVHSNLIGKSSNQKIWGEHNYSGLANIQKKNQYFYSIWDEIQAKYGRPDSILDFGSGIALLSLCAAKKFNIPVVCLDKVNIFKTTLLAAKILEIEDLLTCIEFDFFEPIENRAYVHTESGKSCYVMSNVLCYFSPQELKEILVRCTSKVKSHDILIIELNLKDESRDGPENLLLEGYYMACSGNYSAGYTLTEMSNVVASVGFTPLKKVRGAIYVSEYLG